MGDSANCVAAEPALHELTARGEHEHAIRIAALLEQAECVVGRDDAESRVPASRIAERVGRRTCRGAGRETGVDRQSGERPRAGDLHRRRGVKRSRAILARPKRAGDDPALRKSFGLR